MSSNEKTGALGRDETKHISCGFEGHESDCSNNCEKCAIYIKTCGDELLVEGKVDPAIKQYKRALFVEPKFAEAWVNLGNAFGMKSEYNNALAAFDKAIAIDPVYGNAMFGKAITLRNLGKNEAAMSLANAILLLYDNANVRKFKENLMAAGTLDSSSFFTLDQAIEELTGIAYDILHKNDLLGPSGSVVTERAICQKEDFAAQVYRFCKKRYASSGKKKLNSESILKAFYGSLCTTLFYYNDPNSITGNNTYNYLVDHVDIERVDDVAEKMLNIRGDKTCCDNLWNLIYGYVVASLETFEKITPDSDRESAVIDATESAYMMGMMYAMKWNNQRLKAEQGAAIKESIDRLVASVPTDHIYKGKVLNHGRIPPRHAAVLLTCSHCKKATKHMVVEGHEQILEKYQLLSNEFSQLGFDSTVSFYCTDCAKKLNEIDSLGMPENIVFTVMMPGSKTAAKSHPAHWAYKDTEYRVALAFLRGADTINTISKATSCSFAPEEYIVQICAVLDLNPN